MRRRGWSRERQWSLVTYCGSILKRLPADQSSTFLFVESIRKKKRHDNGEKVARVTCYCTTFLQRTTNSRGESEPLENVENFLLKFYHNIFKQFPGTLKAHLYRPRFIIAIKVSRYMYNPCKTNENHNITFYWSAFKDLPVSRVSFQ